MTREHRIRELAYQLWLERGCPRGGADQDWLEAERRMAAEMAAAEPTQAAASSKGVDEALRETYPASDPLSSHLPDEPPANAEAKWEAAAASDDSKRRANSQRRKSDPPRQSSSARRPQFRRSDQSLAADSSGEGVDSDKPQVTTRTRPPAQ